jgi:hypothetical protein
VAIVFGRFESFETQRSRLVAAFAPKNVDRAPIELFDQAKIQRDQGVVTSLAGKLHGPGDASAVCRVGQCKSSVGTFEIAKKLSQRLRRVCTA